MSAKYYKVLLTLWTRFTHYALHITVCPSRALRGKTSTDAQVKNWTKLKERFQGEKNDSLERFDRFQYWTSVCKTQ